MYEKIKKLCKDKGISVRQMEIDLDLSNGNTCKWSKTEPSFSKVKKIADYFGVPLDYFREEGEINVTEQNDS